MTPASSALNSKSASPPLRNHLWLGGGGIALFIITLAIGNAFQSDNRALTSQMLGHDFLAFYTGGTFARQGRFEQLYDLQTVKQFEHETARHNGLDIKEVFGPWWNPPFYAWVFAPLSALPYSTALNIWRGINLLALAGAIVLLCRMLPNRRTWGLTAMLILISMPFIQAISHAQNTCTSLLLLALAVSAWRADRAFMAGLIGGLLFYKPQLAAVFSLVMILSLGRRAALGLAVTGTSLLLLTAFTMPGALADFLHRLPANLHFMQVENSYLWERHVTFKGFWRLLLQGRDAGEATTFVTTLTIGCSIIFATGLLIALIRARYLLLRSFTYDLPKQGRLGTHPYKNQGGLETRPYYDHLIAATIATMPLLMPFYFDYDLLLLAVPAVLVAGDGMKLQTVQSRAGNTCPMSTSDRWLMWAWTALFVWLMINPGIARRTHVNLTVLLLATVSAMLIIRACRQEPAAAVTSREIQPALAAA